MTIVIHHNPECGTSRNVLAFIRAAGIEPIVIAYLKTGWTRSYLQALFAAADLTARTALRETKSPAARLGLLQPEVDEETLLAQMLEHPVLVNRPIVCSPKGVRLCRPSEAVFDLLPQPLPGPIFKEDGEMVVDEAGRLITSA